MRTQMMIFVGGSSRDTSEKCFECAAQSLGEFIAANNHDLVFGGCNKGLMGAVYREVEKNEKCKIYAIVDEAYESDLQEIEYHTAYVMDTVNQRKDAMIKLADVMVFLPGGIGTIDELMTAIEMARTGKFEGKIVIVNVKKYYDGLIRQLCYAHVMDLSDDIDRFCRIIPTISEAIYYLKGLT